MKKIINIIKARYIISSVSLLVLILIGVFIFKQGNGKYQLITVEKGEVSQKVSVTGKTKAVEEVSLGFENSGKVARSYVDVGSKVEPGQVLASLDQSSAYADLLKAQANEESTKARLDELKKGTRPEELAIAQDEVSNAEISLTDAKTNLRTKIMDAYTRSDDAIYNSTDQLFSNPTVNPQLNMNLSDIQLKNDINNGRFKIESILNEWKKSSFDDVEKTNQNLSEIKDFIDKIAQAVNSQSGNSNYSQTTIDSYKAAISAARTSISTAISNMTTAVEKYNSAESALSLANKNLLLKQKGNTEEVIRAQEANVLQAVAQVRNAEAQLAKMTLYSPINGVVTKQEAKVGEIVTSGKEVISVISDSNFEVESNVSEINIGKVTQGNQVNITLDAFPGETFSGTVAYIDPGETLVDGVVNYKVTISFVEKYSQIKSGLTTNLDIITQTKKDVIRIPQYSLIQKDGKSYVSKLSGVKFEEVPVTVGIIGQDGYVEILSGLSVGDKINSIAISEK